MPIVPRAASPLEALAAEIAGDVDRIERELRAQMAAVQAEAREEIAALRAARAEGDLRVAARLAELRDGAAGPAGEPGPPGPGADLADAPADLVPLIGRAIAMLAEVLPIEPRAPAIVLNMAPAARQKTITTRRDGDGNLIAEVVEAE